MLKQAGVKVGYEKVDPHGAVSSYYAVGDTMYHGPHGFQAREDYSFEHVWELVRDPLKTLASMSAEQGGLSPQWWAWQRRHTGINVNKVGRLRASCEFMLDWKLRCEAMNPEVTYRIEDQQQDWPKIAKRLGVDVEPLPDFVPMNNGRPKPILTWDDIAKEVGLETVERIQKMYEKYGYLAG